MALGRWEGALELGKARKRTISLPHCKGEFFFFTFELGCIMPPYPLRFMLIFYRLKPLGLFRCYIYAFHIHIILLKVILCVCGMYLYNTWKAPVILTYSTFVLLLSVNLHCKKQGRFTAQHGIVWRAEQSKDSLTSILWHLHSGLGSTLGVCCWEVVIRAWVLFLLPHSYCHRPASLTRTWGQKSASSYFQERQVSGSAEMQTMSKRASLALFLGRV